MLCEARVVPAAKVAVLSAKEHSPNLIPVLLYGGSSGVPSLTGEANIHWFREQGGIVYHHNLTFMSDLQVRMGCILLPFGLQQCRYPTFWVLVLPLQLWASVACADRLQLCMQYCLQPSACTLHVMYQSMHPRGPPSLWYKLLCVRM